MNDKEKLWTIAHDIIEMFEKDFGPFKNMALRIAYDYIQDMKETEAKTVLLKIKATLELTSDKNAPKR